MGMLSFDIEGGNNLLYLFFSMAKVFVLFVDFVINPHLFGCIGTNLGVTLVNIETGTQSWVCRCKSDIFSVQLDQSVSSK